MAGRVEREIAYLQLLRHPHIIKLYTVITTPNDIIMVIEYAGGELFEYIVTNGKMTEDSARRFFQQIICAVEYCHRHKIVHRDLKPENLLLDDYLNVISGKLYAGPEVDVWSCGVILYVLLCGRLPFDDDYIPTLFKKIGQGNYSIPHFLSSEARNLIQRMLVVNPLSRITVADIRQDPWFNKGLPEYLRPPPEEFFNTGVDFSRLPTWKSIERGPAERLKGELHEAVVGKLGSTMGYAKDDVQDALNKEEPSAIKDAYMIVRENQMMMRDSRLSNAQNIGNFLAQSPPAWNSYLPSSPRHTPNPQAPNSPSFNPQTPQRTASPYGIKDGLGIAGVPEDVATPGDVGPSPSSSISILPTSLPAYHKAYMSGAPPPPSPAPSSPQITPQQTRRVLRPPNPRIQSSSNRIEGLTPLPPSHAQQAKRPRQTRWQFGIRSRNSPLEAVGCIYRALRKLGAEWQLEDRHNGHNNSQKNNKNKRTQTVPTDPWVIHCRWRRSSHTSSATTKRTNCPPTNPLGEEGLYVHMEIQLYQLEHNFYLVDFKCAGYERLGKRKKEVSSPFPFLELASRLIIQLAEATE
ncbi:kinase-like protein [Tuber magnatum]|uniref:non-specific serine/threonine protein kinase n=1 Tax=Tuber magnatum TaxID=42249 RepID=A0A317SPQ6_9PEZI|nr:kinase-like protein [Tuber magnatum]